MNAINLARSFWSRSTGLWSGKYSLDSYVPNPILLNLFELIVLLILIVLPIFFSFTKSKRRFGPILQKMKDGFLIGCFVPVTTTCINCLINVSWVGYYNDAFAILSVFTSVFILFYFLFEIWCFVEPYTEWNYFFNSEEAYLSFDCHPSSVPGQKFSIWEYTPLGIFILLPSTIYVLTNAGISSPIIFMLA